MTRTLSTLELKWAHYGGEPVTIPPEVEAALSKIQGTGTFVQHSSDFLDFVIDGQPLSEVHANNLVTPFGWGQVEAQEQARKRLLLQLPSDLPDNRRSILVCHICGDIGCGALTAVIEEVENVIMWRDFGYENDYDAESLDLATFRDIGPFVFDKDSYTRALSGAVVDRG